MPLKNIKDQISSVCNARKGQTRRGTNAFLNGLVSVILYTKCLWYLIRAQDQAYYVSFYLWQISVMLFKQ